MEDDGCYYLQASLFRRVYDVRHVFIEQFPVIGLQRFPVRVLVDEREAALLRNGAVYFVVRSDVLAVRLVACRVFVPGGHRHQDDLELWIGLEDAVYHVFQIRLGDFNGPMETLHAVVQGKLDENGAGFFRDDFLVEVRNSSVGPRAGTAAADHGGQARIAFIEDGCQMFDPGTVRREAFSVGDVHLILSRLKIGGQFALFSGVARHGKGAIKQDDSQCFH